MLSGPARELAGAVDGALEAGGDVDVVGAEGGAGWRAGGIEEGEFRDRAKLGLPGHQEELIDAVAATGKPVVVVGEGADEAKAFADDDRPGAWERICWDIPK